ncbi:undecaprenyl-phosphate glucose phosphotransferase [Elongatibacter sediminis]|uniref:Undecaprenyl-phosphate glucose phosphotransferase n=1 Tax=Elongatibacter sediminis TaxID=3119006 RepID=A0AAW9RKT1_9GAMM
MRQANALLVIMVGFLLAWWLRFGYAALPESYLVAMLVTLVLAAVVLPATGAFRQDFEWAIMRRVRRLLAGWAIVVLGLVSLAAMLKATDTFSRIWFGSWVLMTSVGLVMVTLLAHAAAVRERRREQSARPVILVGAGDAARRIERRLRDDPATRMNLVACFGESWSDEPVRQLAELEEYLMSHPVREVWIAVPWDCKDLLDQALEALRESVVDVNVVPDLHQYRLLNQNIIEWGGLPVISLAGTPMTGAELRLKAVFDWGAALVLMLFLSPLMLLIGLMIRVSSPGPVLFRQQRQGLGGDPISILKFRTMKLHSDGPGQMRQATREDERVTRVGHWLRRSSLDELPQLFNVLKGEMSLVGPRPHPTELNHVFKSNIPRYMLRHKVKPGITGWAQVNGFRGETETPEKMALRIEHDLWYIQNWSLWLDLKILMMTPLVLMHRNAY